MFSNFLVGLREGLEAALVVGIIAAYLVRTNNRGRLAALWSGVGVAAAASLAVGAALTFTSRSLDERAQQVFEGATSIAAVALVTAMVFWMRTQSRTLRGQLEGRTAAALAAGPVALAAVAFLAVGREGLETALFLWPTIQAAGSGIGPVTGAFAGLASAALLGWLVYRRSVTLDLARFFRITGSALIVVAAGVLAYGVHELQEAALLPGEHAIAFDVRAAVPLSSWYGSLLRGIFGFTPESSWLQVLTWIAYLVPVSIAFLRPAPRPAPAPA